jgi:hypothetical protein
MLGSKESIYLTAELGTPVYYLDAHFEEMKGYLSEEQTKCWSIFPALSHLILECSGTPLLPSFLQGKLKIVSVSMTYYSL